MFALSVCCVIPNRFAALLKLCSEATAAKYSMLRKFMAILPCVWRLRGVCMTCRGANQCHSIKPVIDISLVCISPVILGHGSCE